MTPIDRFEMDDNWRKRRNRSVLFLALPVLGNATVAFFLYLRSAEVITGSALLSHLAGFLMVVIALACFFGRLLGDIGPGRTIAVLTMNGLILIIGYAGLYRWYGVPDDVPALHLAESLYFSIVTWTTLGYGDITPAHDLRLLAALQALLGYVYLGLTVGLSASVIVSQRNDPGRRPPDV